MNYLNSACRVVLTGIVCLMMNSSTWAQVKPYSFPKIKPEDFKSKVYEKDTSAVAVVLGDVGESYLEYNDIKGFQLIFERHRRIRILSKEGYDYATGAITLYQKDGNLESLATLKGYTYNLVDGKVEDEKLGNSNIFDERINRNWIRTKYTMPDVKVGSIIDIRYKIISDYIWNLRDWEFQSTIPVQWSEYTVKVPEYFVFSKLVHGSQPFAISEITTASGSVTIVTKNRDTGTNGQTVQTSFDREQVEFIQNVYHFATSDVPALKEEPYATAMTNFITKVEFELLYSQFPKSGRTNYTTSWQEICDGLIHDADFGDQLSRTGIVKEPARVIYTKNATQLEKMIAAHAYIRSRMNWNGKTGLYPTTTLHDAFDKNTGNATDINLLLFLMLKELGLDASPVILSTRDNGILVESHPVFTQVNYVVASVVIDGKTFLLDATGKNRPYNFLPQRCL
ncbi:MAG TPA: DUF3857 domain-containing protein, partial [Bacteroidales bacterium]|nr:DUF3857 domain-containing protein [Bacteroidales bacterium]